MQLQNLKPTHKKKKPKRIGRGGKKGTYSGRGMKGQKSRAGARFQPIVRELVKKYPKLRGYRFSSGEKIRRMKPFSLNLDALQNKFKEGEEITPKALLEKGLVRRIKGGTPRVKILSRGEVKNPLTFKGCQVSKVARDKIEKAGGKIS